MLTVSYQPSQAHIDSAHAILREELRKPFTAQFEHEGAIHQFEVSFVPPDPPGSEIAGLPGLRAHWDKRDPQDSRTPIDGEYFAELLPSYPGAGVDAKIGGIFNSHIEDAIVQAASQGALSERGALLAHSLLGIDAQRLNAPQTREFTEPIPPPERLNFNPESNARRLSAVRETMRTLERGVRSAGELFQDRINALEQAPSARSAMEVYRFEPALAEAIMSPPPGVRPFGGIEYAPLRDPNTGEAYVIVGREAKNRQRAAETLLDIALAHHETLPIHDIRLTDDQQKPLQKENHTLTLADTAGLLEFIAPSASERPWLEQLIDQRMQREGTDRAGRAAFELVVESQNSALAKSVEASLKNRNAQQQQQQRAQGAQSL